MTLAGTDFGTDPSAVRVTFDGARATVLSVSPTEIVVEPSIETWFPRHVAVSVERDSQVSNAVSFELVPSGTARMAPYEIPSNPTGVVQIGADVYVASANFAGPGGGLYKIGADGRARRVLRPLSVVIRPPGEAPFEVYDAPVALATDGTDVYYTTALGAVRRYSPSTGRVRELYVSPNHGNEFPGLTGLAVADGYLFVADRNLPEGGAPGGVVRIAPDGKILPIPIEKAYGVATDGERLFVTNDFNQVVVVADAFAESPFEDFRLETGYHHLRGVAVAGGTLFVSMDDGAIGSIELSSLEPENGNLEIDPRYLGLVYPADGLWANDDGLLLLAQSEGQVVRRIEPDETPRIIASGVRMFFASTLIGNRIYAAGPGPALFSSGLSLDEDSVLVEFGPDGSRVLAQGSFFIGLALLPSGSVAVSDLVGGRIVAVSLQTGATSDLVVSTDPQARPAGMVSTEAGALIYVALGFMEGGISSWSVHKREVDGSTATFATGEGAQAPFLTRARDKLLFYGLGDDSGMLAVDANAGGAVSVLVPSASVGQATAVGGAPDGSAYLVRWGGQILSLDPATGALWPFGHAFAGVAAPGGELLSAPFSVTFRPDGTLLLPDYGQQGIVAVAP